MKQRQHRPRPIDQLREGEWSIEIRPPDDDSPILVIIPTNDRMLIIKGKGVYEVKEADQIDPHRTNIAIPNTGQRLLPYGADDPWIGATLLTAHYMLKELNPYEKIDTVEGFALVLKIVGEISGALQLHQTFVKAESDIVAKRDAKIGQDRSVLLPAMGNVETRCNEFLQRIDHALEKLFRLVQMFYPVLEPKGGWTSVQKMIDSEQKYVDNFPRFIADVLPFLLLIRNARNCVEHPMANKRLCITDFALDSNNALQPPMVQVIHPKTPQENVPVSAFFSQTLQQVVNTVELMIVFLCGRRVAAPLQVTEIPALLKNEWVKRHAD